MVPPLYSFSSVEPEAPDRPNDIRSQEADRTPEHSSTSLTMPRPSHILLFLFCCNTLFIFSLICMALNRSGSGFETPSSLRNCGLPGFLVAATCHGGQLLIEDVCNASEETIKRMEHEMKLMQSQHSDVSGAANNEQMIHFMNMTAAYHAAMMRSTCAFSKQVINRTCTWHSQAMGKVCSFWNAPAYIEVPHKHSSSRTRRNDEDTHFEELTSSSDDSQDSSASPSSTFSDDFSSSHDHPDPHKPRFTRPAASHRARRSGKRVASSVPGVDTEL